MSEKDLSREEFIGLTMYGEAISVQVRDRGQVALHVKEDAPRSSENFHPVLLEARDVARLRALLNEAERRGAVSEAMSARELGEAGLLAEEVYNLPVTGGYERTLAKHLLSTVAEVRRSHAENAELRERIGELERALKDVCFWSTAALGLGKDKRRLEKVADIANLALSPKQEEEEKR